MVCASIFQRAMKLIGHTILTKFLHRFTKLLNRGPAFEIVRRRSQSKLICPSAVNEARTISCHASVRLQLATDRP